MNFPACSAQLGGLLGRGQLFPFSVEGHVYTVSVKREDAPPDLLGESVESVGGE